MPYNFTLIFFLLLLFILITPNAIHALLALILLFINFSMILFIIDSPFLAFSYILVYIGAICVLFLYIILLLHLRTYSLVQRVNVFLLSCLTLIFLVLFVLINLNSEAFFVSALDYDLFILTDLYLFATYLFDSHLIFMIFGIFLLLVALIIAIFLSTSFIKQGYRRKPIIHFYGGM